MSLHIGIVACSAEGAALCYRTICEAARHGYRRVGLTGTRWLVESEVYPSALLARKMNYVRPSGAEREEMNRIIMTELVLGEVNSDSVRYFEKVIQGMKDDGADAVVLGCTEIPLIINDQNSSLWTLDSTRQLARAALYRAAETLQ